MKLKSIYRIVAVTGLSSLFFFGGCVKDPSSTGVVSAGNGLKWEPGNSKTCYWYSKVGSKIKEENSHPDLNKELSPIELIDFALWNNPKTRVTWENAKALAYTVGMQKSFLYPTVNLQETLNYTKQKIGPGIPQENYFRTLVTDLFVSYLIFDFGGRNANIEAARQALYSSNWVHNRMLQTIINNVVNAYYDQINANAIYLETLRTQEDARVTLLSAENMQRVGVKTIADVLQAKSNFANSQLQVVNAWGELMVSKATLSRVIGISPDIQLKLQLLPKNLKIRDISFNIEELISVAKRQRPDLAAIHARFLESVEQVKASWSAGMPTLGGSVDILDQNVLNRKHLDGYVYTGSISLNVPIFNGFFYVNQVRAAKAQTSAFCAEFENQVENVLLEVLEAYYQYQTSNENIGYSKEFLESSNLNYEVALANYQMGTGTILDVLNALRDLARARSQYIQSRTNLLKSLANIAYVTGTIGNNNFGLQDKEQDE